MDFFDDQIIDDLGQRVSEIEKKVFKKRIPATLNQRLLLLKHTGMSESVSEKFKTKEALYDFLSILLDADRDNIKKAFTVIHNNNSSLVTEKNYKFIVEIFSKLDLKEAKESSEMILKKISRKKG